MNYKKLTLVVTALATTSVCAAPVYADAISPQIRDSGTTYSKEKANHEFYGTGIAGRAMEAMSLRFEVERLLQDGEYDLAIPKARKAVQLDPGAPECHLLLARALTKKFYTTQGPIDEKLLNQCLQEWLLLWHHDADQFEQVEAKLEARRMLKIAKVLQKKKQAEMQARLAAKAEVQKQLAKERAAETEAENVKAKAAKAESTKATASKEEDEDEKPL